MAQAIDFNAMCDNKTLVTTTASEIFTALLNLHDLDRVTRSCA